MTAPDSAALLAQARIEADAYRQAVIQAGVGARVEARLAALAGQGRNLQDPLQHPRLREQMLHDVSACRPMSLLRLGDGEGNTLFWRQHGATYPALARLCMERIWAVMFGGLGARPAIWDRLGAEMAEAVRNATHLGVPTPPQFAAALKANDLQPQPGADLRGQTGIVGVWDWLASHPGIGAGAGTVVVNWHVHQSLLHFYADLVRAARNVSVITCYPGLLAVLHRSCEVTEGETWLIPPQAVNIQGTPPARHYPTAFDRIMADIGSRDRRGQLVFVGAGLPGKAYCEAIRRAGGMAIDVGSLMDVWVGQSVRPYHSAAFVDAHRIEAASAAPAAPQASGEAGEAGAPAAPSPANTPRNQLEIQVFGLRRSGNHVLLSWLAANLPKPAHFLNNVDPFSDPFVGFHNATMPNTVPILQQMGAEQLEAIRAAPKDSLVYNYEHLPLAQLRQRPLVPDHDAMLGTSARTMRLLILRDFWNWMASRAKQFINRGVEDPERLRRNLAHEATLWKQYAREFEGSTRLIEREGFVAVKYNEFVASADARQKLLDALGLPVRTLSIDYVPDLGLGSSFDGTSFSGQAQKMDVGGRWKYLANEPLLKDLLTRWRADDELLSMNGRLFDMADPFAEPPPAETARGIMTKTSAVVRPPEDSPAHVTAESAPVQQQRLPNARAVLLSMLPQGSRGAEIGVHLGDFSARLLEAVRPRELILIDPWLLVDDAPRRNAWYGAGRLGQSGMDDRHASVLRRFAPQVASGQVRVLRQMSGEALGGLPDGGLDWVYVDGDHRYEGVREDLALALAKVRDGGLICGDDYTLGSWWKDGVVRAVNEFIGSSPVRVLFFMEGQFILEKLPSPSAPAPAPERVRAAAARNSTPAGQGTAGQGDIGSSGMLEQLDGDSRRLLLIFGGIAGGMGMPPFEFVSAAGGLDTPRIFFRDAAQAWYQRGLSGVSGGLTGLAGHIARRIDALGPDEVVFVGNSMGGYAALMLCGLVGTGSALVFSPQTRISPAGRALLGDGRWAGQMARLHAQVPPDAVLDLPEWLDRQRPGLRAAVHVSTTDALDLRHADALSGLSGVTVLRHGFAGHNLVRALRDRGDLASLLVQ